jgi:hypothetical protein
LETEGFYWNREQYHMELLTDLNTISVLLRVNYKNLLRNHPILFNPKISVPTSCIEISYCCQAEIMLHRDTVTTVCVRGAQLHFKLWLLF